VTENLTEGFFSWLNGEVRPAVMGQVVVASLWGQLARSTGKRSGAGQRNAVENDEVEVSFIGPKRRWRGEETVAGAVGIKRFGFEAVKEVGEVGWRRFGGGNEGGDSTLRFVFLRLREGG
jgi:hypothetical protein